jgi:hypothetical protein
LNKLTAASGVACIATTANQSLGEYLNMENTVFIGESFAKCGPRENNLFENEHLRGAWRNLPNPLKRKLTIHVRKFINNLLVKLNHDLGRPCLYRGLLI